jgi:hypothetical protein
MKLLAFAIFLLLVQVMAAKTCTAAPLTLNCATQDGTPTPDIILDIDKRRMTWGSSQLEIREVTDRYITAFKPPSQSWEKVGGEVWVLDRATGDYLRASVGFVSRGVNGRYTPPTLEASTYRGRCTRPLL